MRFTSYGHGRGPVLRATIKKSYEATTIVHTSTEPSKKSKYVKERSGGRQLHLFHLQGTALLSQAWSTISERADCATGRGSTSIFAFEPRNLVECSQRFKHTYGR